MRGNKADGAPCQQERPNHVDYCHQPAGALLGETPERVSLLERLNLFIIYQALGPPLTQLVSKVLSKAPAS